MNGPAWAALRAQEVTMLACYEHFWNLQRYRIFHKVDPWYTGHRRVSAKAHV
jgi:hypothetical protein